MSSKLPNFQGKLWDLKKKLKIAHIQEKKAVNRNYLLGDPDAGLGR